MEIFVSRANSQLLYEVDDTPSHSNHVTGRYQIEHRLENQILHFQFSNQEKPLEEHLILVTCVAIS